jgi:hypothetical protein
MIPFILAAVGGYLIGDSMKDSKKFANGGEIEYTVEYEVFVDDADDPYTDNRTKTFKDLDEAIDFSNRVYASVGYEIIKDGEVVEYGYVDTKNKRLSKYADGGEVEGLDVYESVFLYVKRGLKQPFREDYLKPIGLYNTEKAKEVEASLKKKGCLNSAGAINELGKNKAKEVNNFLDGDLSRYITTGREYRKEKFESIKEKFVNK